METTETVHYTVKTAQFEGPLDLLLSLIESRKLFINEISLAQVTDDYLVYIKSIPKNEISEITGFIVIAATLILIKSRSLLPGLALTVDEEEKIVDLETRLKMYQVIRDISMQIKSKFGAQVIYPAPERSKQKFFEPVFTPDQRMTLANIRIFAGDAINAIPKKQFLPQVAVHKVISIEEMIDSLTSRIQEGMRMSFKAFSGASSIKDAREQKVYVIVSFLAMLELVRQGIVDVVQNSQFDDMEIVKQETIEVTEFQEG